MYEHVMLALGSEPWGILPAKCWCFDGPVWYQRTPRRICRDYDVQQKEMKRNSHQRFVCRNKCTHIKSSHFRANSPSPKRQSVQINSSLRIVLFILPQARKGIDIGKDHMTCSHWVETNMQNNTYVGIVSELDSTLPVNYDRLYRIVMPFLLQPCLLTPSLPRFLALLLSSVFSPSFFFSIISGLQDWETDRIIIQSPKLAIYLKDR